MNWKALLIVGGIIFLIVAGFITARFLFPAKITNSSRSGIYLGNQIWNGDILITGDTTIIGSLTVLPGTIVRFAVQDDQHSGDETSADGYNDDDPTRLVAYSKTHSELVVLGKLTAIGLVDKKIIFTSAALKPKLADWVGISPLGDGSRIEYAIIEWSRHGIGIGNTNTPNSVFQKNIMHNTLWGPLSLGSSSAQAYDNELFECGHEGIDVQGGNPIIIGNYVHDCHAGIIVLAGSPTIKNNVLKNIGDGVHIQEGANPVLENNTVELALENNTKEWRYEGFAYRMYER
ncbi:MAG: right-handed parallel beta-helix repeat-containing protein [Candidatus Woesearchaeota archaeon]|nr:right-handed parallel beta-helix repeat-containing protein [Candidatus Woesearchaeota archaeon]